MLAVDTNVVIRFLLNDDPEQAARARRVIGERECWLSLTVLLETEWVLRSAARLDPQRIHHILCNFIGLPTITVELPVRVSDALALFAEGMDFADALHLTAAMQAGCEALATFDRKLAATARKAEAGGVELL